MTSLSFVVWGHGIMNMMAQAISLISVSPIESLINSANLSFNDS